MTVSAEQRIRRTEAPPRSTVQAHENSGDGGGISIPVPSISIPVPSVTVEMSQESKEEEPPSNPASAVSIAEIAELKARIAELEVLVQGEVWRVGAVR